jgi:hypothetical protein
MAPIVLLRLFRADCDFNQATPHPADPIKCRTSTQRTQAPESVDAGRASRLDPLENKIGRFDPFAKRSESDPYLREAERAAPSKALWPTRAHNGQAMNLSGDVCVGIVRARIGEWLLPRFNFLFVEAVWPSTRRSGNLAVASSAVGWRRSRQYREHRRR